MSTFDRIGRQPNLGGFRPLVAASFAAALAVSMVGGAAAEPRDHFPGDDHQGAVEPDRDHDEWGVDHDDTHDESDDSDDDYGDDLFDDG